MHTGLNPNLCQSYSENDIPLDFYIDIDILHRHIFFTIDSTFIKSPEGTIYRAKRYMPNTTKTLLNEHQDISFVKKFATKLYNDNEKYKAKYSKLQKHKLLTCELKLSVEVPHDTLNFSNIVFMGSLYIQQFGRNSTSSKIYLAAFYSILLEELDDYSH